MPCLRTYNIRASWSQHIDFEIEKSQTKYVNILFFSYLSCFHLWPPLLLGKLLFHWLDEIAWMHWWCVGMCTVKEVSAVTPTEFGCTNMCDVSGANPRMEWLPCCVCPCHEVPVVVVLVVSVVWQAIFGKNRPTYQHVICGFLCTYIKIK